MKSRPNGHILIVFAVVITVLILMRGVPGPDSHAKSQKDTDIERLTKSLKGPDLYHAHCAPCHGADGKGDGPVAPALKGSLPDLTTIALRNGGLFPTERVRNVIAGEEVFIAHGSREMPIWGEIFHQVQDDRDYGNVRLQNVVEYLRSIQKK